jgi:hypothetical protein
VTAGPDAGAALTLRANRLASRHRELILDERLSGVQSDSARFDILSSALDRAEDRVVAIREQEADATAAYGRGSTTGAELARRLARTRGRGVALDSFLGRVRTAGRSVGARAIVERSDAVALRASTLTGPVRSRVVSAIRGEQPTQVYVETANETLVVAATTDDTYRREVSVPVVSDESKTVITLATAITRVAEYYPSAYADRTRVEAGGNREAGLYRIGVIGPTSTRTDVFLEARSRRVFRETRVRPLRSLPTVESSATTADGVRLSVSTAYRGGPLLVHTTREASQDGVAATIRVDDTRVGTTGPNGRLWTVAPRGQSTIRANVTDGPTLSVMTPPVSPPPLNGTRAR